MQKGWVVMFSVLTVLVYGCHGQEKSFVQSEVQVAAPLPPHTVADDSSLAPKDGRRVQLNSDNPDLTKEECTALVNAYRKKGGKEGQVSVHKPSKMMRGSLTPFCYENFDGKGIVFNDSMF